MYEDHTIEEKYLHNFSSEEKKEFYRQHEKWEKDMAKYKVKLYELMSSDSPAIFGNWEPKSNTSLEIRYVLNRIAANDPRDTSFELSLMDAIPNADRLALDIAKAFRNNTVCKKVVLNEIGLTDNGLLPILHVLKTKQLDLLDIGSNKLTNESIHILDSLLSDPETKWGYVNLGEIQINSDQKMTLAQHKNLVFVPVTPIPTIRTIVRNLWQKQ